VKITDIAIFMIAFVMMMSGVSTLHLYGGGSFTVSTVPEFNGTAMAESLNSVNSSMTYEGWGIFSSVGMLFNSANIWMEVVGIVFATGFFIGSIIPFLPVEFCIAITTIVNALYGIAIYQIISGRSEKVNG
jgi:hypothetical protein